MLEGQAELAAALVQEAEVEVAPQVPRREVDRRAELPLGVGEPPGLEEDQAQVRTEDLGGRVLLQQRARGRGRFVVAAALELEQGDEVQNVLVLGPERARLFELRPRVVEAPRTGASPRAVEVQEEEPLIHGGTLSDGARHGEPDQPRRRGADLVVKMTRFVRASRVHCTGLPSPDDRLR